jgi:hypothetical protein
MGSFAVDPRLLHATTLGGTDHGGVTIELPLDVPVVYRKTAKGVQEIETRAARLLPRLRSALIVVDGKRSDVELAALLVQGAASLLALAEQGFIEAVPAPIATPRPQPRASVARPTAAAAPAMAAAAAPAAPSRPDFEMRRRQVLRAFTDCVGPAGDGLSIKLEKAKTLDDFRAQLHHAVSMVEMLRGRSQAQAFAAKLDDF